MLYSSRAIVWILVLILLVCSHRESIITHCDAAASSSESTVTATPTARRSLKKKKSVTILTDTHISQTTPFQPIQPLSNVSIRFTSSSALEPIALHPTPSSSCPTPPVMNHYKNKAKWVEGFKHSLASGLAAALSKTLLAPFDTIKTMQQQQQQQTLYTSAAGQDNLHFWQAIAEIQKRPKGLWELYSGLGVSAIGAMPSVGLYFGVYSVTKQTLGPWLRQVLSTSSSSQEGPEPPSPAWIETCTIALSAAIGNTVASFSRVPYEVIKQKLQMGQYPNTWVAISSMIRDSSSSSHPLRAFFPKGGISAQMMRDVPYAVFTLVSYETLRSMYHRKNPKKNNKMMNGENHAKKTAPWADMMMGAIAGGIGSFLTNPMDVIKTRMQMDTYGSLYQGSIWICASQTLSKDGPAAFLRGSIPRLLHKVPANGAFFLFYEWFRHVLCVEEYSPLKNK
jgi:hypothetical protein